MVSMTLSPTWPPWQRHGKIGGVVEEVVGVVEGQAPLRGGEDHQVPGECAAEDCWTSSTSRDSGAVPGPEEVWRSGCWTNPSSATCQGGRWRRAAQAGCCVIRPALSSAKSQKWSQGGKIVGCGRDSSSPAYFCTCFHDCQ